MKEKNKGGRPLKFKTPEEMDKAIEKYFLDCDSRIVKVYDKRKQEVVELNRPIPYTIEGLAATLGVDRHTLNNYEKRDEFFTTIKRAKDKVLQNMVERSLDGDNNPTMSIFLLKNNNGYSDKQELEHSGEIDNPSFNLVVKPKNGN